MDENNQNDSLFPGFKDAEEYSKAVLKSILSCNAAAKGIPSAGSEYELYSTFESFCTFMSAEGKTILSMMNALAEIQGARQLSFENLELEEKSDLLVDVNDMLLENVGSYLDEVAGHKKPESELYLATKKIIPINASWNKKINSPASPQTYSLLCAKNVTRPQLSFKNKVDNSNTAFEPIIKEKPNAVRPLAILLEKIGDKEEFSHPYEWEIERFQPNKEQLLCTEPVFPKPLDETPLIHVESNSQLLDLCKELKKQKEIAIDLEHHSYRSFQGITCLMQISTRDKDFIIDVLKLRSELHVLNEVFTDPRIIKVLHGADMDILWLQRDFGLYIVNLFDTGQAARLLNFAHFSLSYLFKRYLKTDLDKKFQLADWRIRPLPSEMIKYAREDTHYLLYIYDCLKNDLVKSGNELKNLLHSVFERSKEICLKKYEKPLFTDNKYLELYKKSQKMFNARQLYCLKELYAWRDRIAREEDESYGFVLPNHMLLQIAAVLPREQQGILACCNPVPPLVKQHLNELHVIVMKANKHSLMQSAQSDHQVTCQSFPMNNILDLSNIVHCPHDIHHYEGRGSNFFKTSGNAFSVPLKTKPSLSIYDELEASSQKNKNKVSESTVSKVADITKGIISPYQRYLLTHQFHAMQQDEDIEEPVENSDKKEKETHEKKFIAEVNYKTEASSSRDKSAEIVDVDTPVKKETVDTETDDVICEENVSTPLPRKEKKKRRRKKNKFPVPTIPLSTSPEIIVESPPKKMRSSDETERKSFKPFDYSQVDTSAFEGKKKNKAFFNPHTDAQKTNVSHNTQAKKNRKRQGKQFVFSSKNSGQNKMNWPGK